MKKAREEGRDWYVLDLAGLLDRLASRRYLEDPHARPPWWHSYDLPPELAALDPPPDSRFLTVEGGARKAGGLFSLDGVHPTTVAYGVIAQELINLMVRAGVDFAARDSAARQEPVRVDFARLIARDTLISDPPASLTSDLKLAGWLDEHLDWAERLLRVGSSA